MKLKVGLEKINNYFVNISPDQLYRDLVECGLSEIDSWADAGVELACHTETTAYSLKANRFGLDTDTSSRDYSSRLAEAA